MTIRHNLVIRITHYIKSRHYELESFSLDYADLLENGTEEILHKLGIDEPLSDEERRLIAKELLKIAVETQNEEMFHLYHG